MKTYKKRQKRARVTIDLQEKEYAELCEIENMTSASTKAEVLRKALKLYGVLVRQTQQGDKKTTISQSDRVLILL